MKNSSTIKKALCFLLIALLIIPNVSFPTVSLSESDGSEEQPAKLNETVVDTTTDFIDSSTALGESAFSYVGINDGDYYIINVISEKFLENPGDFTVSVSSLSTQADISWTFEDLGYGDYCIKDPLNNNLALFAIGDEVELGNAGSAPSPYYRWNILSAENGEFIIKNKGSESVLRFDGGSIILDEDPNPSDDDYAQHTWAIFEDDTYITFIDHLYDQGYSVRFAVMDTDTERLIRNYHYEAAQRLFSFFNVATLAIYNPCTSIADECKLQTDGALTPNTCDNPCLHLNQQHIVRDRLVIYNLFVGTDISGSALWTGHVLKNDEPSAFYRTWNAIIISPCVTSRYHPETEAEIIAIQTIYSLTHELSHQIGAPDHYCYGATETENCVNENCDTCRKGFIETRICLMGGRNTSLIYSEEMYCDDCIDTINDHLEDHH